RIGALAKVAKILLRLNFHPTVRVEILPRMAEDFRQHGITQRLGLRQLSQAVGNPSPVYNAMAV
ncbi:MAG: hypothetical protein HQL01_12410, partial [Nitrospirae bacterium]|nr:hypothetical protein [Nitrospirota bacterium]